MEKYLSSSHFVRAHTVRAIAVTSHTETNVANRRDVIISLRVKLKGALLATTTGHLRSAENIFSQYQKYFTTKSLGKRFRQVCLFLRS